MLKRAWSQGYAQVPTKSPLLSSVWTTRVYLAFPGEFLRGARSLASTGIYRDSFSVPHDIVVLNPRDPMFLRFRWLLARCPALFASSAEAVTRERCTSAKPNDVCELRCDAGALQKSGYRFFSCREGGTWFPDVASNLIECLRMLELSDSIFLFVFHFSSFLAQWLMLKSTCVLFQQ